MNDHCIRPSPEKDRWYYDYGPMLDRLRGKRWVLEPHCVEVAGEAAKVNLFRAEDGLVVPVVFAGAQPVVRLTVGPVPGLKKNVRCEVLHPGEQSPSSLPAVWKHGRVEVEVPLQRGCALVILK